MSRLKSGDRIRNRKGRVGVVVGASDDIYARVRYDDGKRDTWVQQRNLEREVQGQ